MEFVKPVIEYAELSPLLIVFGVACLGVLVEAFVPRGGRYLTQVSLGLVGPLAALGAGIWVGIDLGEHGPARGLVAWDGALAVDGPALFLGGLDRESDGEG